MILNFSDLIVFNAGHVLLFLNDLVVDGPVGLITCVKRQFRITATLLWFRGSAQGVVGVIKFPGGTGPGTEENDEEDVLRVPCVMA